MRRLLRISLLAAALVTVLCVSAMAADVMDAGFYSIENKSGVTVTPQASSGSIHTCSANVDRKEGYETFYAGSDKLSVKVTGLTAGQQYLVLLVTGDGQTVTEDSICYIDQKSPTGTEVTFDVYPKLPESSGEMTLIVTGSGGYTRKDVSLGYAVSGTYEKAPYKLGDVNDDTAIDSDDALLVLKHSVHLVTLDPTPQLAADVNKDTHIDSDDALLILKYSVHLITEF